jgi:hypothetical protein
LVGFFDAMVFLLPLNTLRAIYANWRPIVHRERVCAGGAPATRW